VAACRSTWSDLNVLCKYSPRPVRIRACSETLVCGSCAQELIMARASLEMFVPPVVVVLLVEKVLGARQQPSTTQGNAKPDADDGRAWTLNILKIRVAVNDDGNDDDGDTRTLLRAKAIPAFRIMILFLFIWMS